jgi:hypothetical protein
MTQNKNNNNRNDNELIINYLKNNLEPEVKADLEKRLAEDKDFRQEFKNAASLHIGVQAYAKAQTAGIDSFSLAEYAENPDLLDSETRREIEIQLKKSPELAEELGFLREPGINPRPHPDKRESFLSKIIDLLLKPAFQFRPAYTFIVILLIAIPTFFALNDRKPSQIPEITYTLTPGTRAIPDDNLVTLDRRGGTIIIEISIATLPDALYDFEMSGPDGIPIITWNSIKPQKTFAFELSASYFPSEGIYTIKAKELKKDGIEERENFRFKIVFTN